MIRQNGEWLVADHRGGFAMGTAEGLRTRKYHGFFSGIASRSEMAFLSDIEVKFDGESLWPHRFAGTNGPVVDLPSSGLVASFKSVPSPTWTWTREGGILTFRVDSSSPGVIRLTWDWTGRSAAISIRPFFAMRRLHALGGQTWNWDFRREDGLAVVSGPEGEQIFQHLQGNVRWEESPEWYRAFFYTEEAERGYESREDVYSAGILHALLDRKNSQLVWRLSLDQGALATPEPIRGRVTALPAITDFVLLDPPGVVAGYPWFGEWGRDTFVSLPGIISGWLASHAGAKSDEVWDWGIGVLRRWGSFIRSHGMLPNVVEPMGTHQWDSADATLWWSHSLASLWTLGLKSDRANQLKQEFGPILDLAIDTIRNGRHAFLKLSEDETLEVTQGHATWMDARVDGIAVTPRTGKLPDLNAIWFQALCLQALWREQNVSSLEATGRSVLACQEAERPNRVFLHSIPLAPSFVLGEWTAAQVDLRDLRDRFLTPVGLRTLPPGHPEFHGRCVGNQRQRDLAYHRGPVWGWLGGHYEMMKQRVIGGDGREELFSDEILEVMPIERHIAEIFDAEAPFTARGAPAQAWSIACREEARARKTYRLDAKVKTVLESYEKRSAR